MTSAFSWQNSISLCPASLATYKPYGSHAGTQITLQEEPAANYMLSVGDTLSSQKYK